MTRLGGKILEMKKVHKSFGDKKILNGFDYTFKRGERIGIVGKNGVLTVVNESSTEPEYYSCLASLNTSAGTPMVLDPGQAFIIPKNNSPSCELPKRRFYDHCKQNRSNERELDSSGCSKNGSRDVLQQYE